MGEIFLKRGIVLFQRTVPHYRKEVFQVLYEKLGVILCVGKKGPKNTYLSQELPSSLVERVRDFYPIPSVKNLVYMNIFSPLMKYRPGVIITEFSILILSNYLLLFLKPFFRYKLIIWSPVLNPRIGFSPETSFRDRLRVWWMNRSDAVLTYSKNGRKQLIPYVDDPKKIFVAQNTLYTPALLLFRDNLRKKGMNQVKRELGLSAQYNLMFIGRLIQEKKVLLLIEVFQKVIPRIPDIHLHIVGDGPEKRRLDKKIRELGLEDKVTLYGSLTEFRASGKMLFASDLTVIPGTVGLAVVHSFCFDTPVVTLKPGEKDPGHSPEIEYLVHGSTGFEADSVESMVDMIMDFITNHKMQKHMGKEIEQTVTRVCPFDRMIKGFEDSIAYLKGKRD